MTSVVVGSAPSRAALALPRRRNGVMGTRERDRNPSPIRKTLVVRDVTWHENDVNMVWIRVVDRSRRVCRPSLARRARRFDDGLSPTVRSVRTGGSRELSVVRRERPRARRELSVVRHERAGGSRELSRRSSRTAKRSAGFPRRSRRTRPELPARSVRSSRTAPELPGASASLMVAGPELSARCVRSPRTVEHRSGAFHSVPERAPRLPGAPASST